MKNFKIAKYTWGIILASVLILAGCKKSKQENIVNGIYLIPTSQYASEEYKIEFSSTPQIIRFAAALSQPVAGKVQAFFLIDTSLVNVFNTTYGTNYAKLPDGSVKLGAGNATILSGEKLSTKDSIVINSILLNPDRTYLVPVRINSISGGEVTLRAAMVVKYFVVKVKSPYEGNYVSNGYFYHPTAPRDMINLNKTLVKTGAFSVKVDLGDLGSSGYNAILTVDPATNAVTITEAPGAAGAPYTMFTSDLPNSNPGYTAAWAGSTQCNNTYNPATKTFYLRYGYMGGTGWRVTEEIIKIK